MRIPCWIVVGVIGLALSPAARAQEETKVTGRVVDAAGKPLAGAEVATAWMAEPGGVKPYLGVATNAEGQFVLAVTFRSRKQGLMAMDKDRKTGGLVLLEEKSAGKPVEIKLGPLVHVHGRLFCTELNKRPPWINLFVDSGSYSFLRWYSKDGSFSLRLPPGPYRLRTAAPDCQGVEKTISLQADTPDVDLKVLDVPPSILSRHIGKELPKWHATDARGVKKTVQLADYKGKWVLVEFWAYWCGPCVVKSLPNLIDLYEDHNRDRDKFEILSFHNNSVKDFADLDRKIERPRARFWDGRNLPFPILLDGTGDTFKDFGIESIPTILLIDPEGKLVGRVDVDELAKKLPPLPLAPRIARGLDRSLFVSLRDYTLVQAIQSLSQASRLPIRLDTESLKSVGVAVDTQVLLKISGRVSLRSALHLLLETDGLAYEQDEKGLVIRSRKSAGSQPERLTEPQRAAVQRIERALNQKVSYEFQDKPLVEAAEFFRGLTLETFVSDPVARKAGRLDLKIPVTGSAKQIPLREALTKLLDPIGLRYTVRDEVIVLTAKPRATTGK